MGSSALKMEERPLLYMMTWRCTRACNYNCTYCSFGSQPYPVNEINTEGGKKIVDELYGLGAKWFGLSGGEPLVRKDIFEIIEHAKSLGMNVSLITNGYFAKGNILEKLIRNEVMTAVSLDGTEQTNDMTRGKGSYKIAVEAMKNLSDGNVFDCIVSTLNRRNCSEVEHIADLGYKYNATRVVYHNYIPVGRAQEHLDLAPTPEQYEETWNRVYDLMQQYQNKMSINVYCPFFARIAKERGMPDFDYWFENVFLGQCFIGGRYMGLLENGDIRPCGFNEGYRTGNIKNQSMKEIWTEMQTSDFTLKLKDRSNLKGKCGVCEYRDICGGCRTRAEVYTGDLFESDPACAYIPKVLREQ
ncbi:MAG: radical SAM protein [archaeon]|nr:radical SAM protein [Candidatus Bathyarchaeum sp.]